MQKGTYMKMKMLLPFWLFLLRLHSWLTDGAERTAEWKQSAISFGWQEMKYNGCIRCYDGGECTTSDIKITRDEAMSAQELNKICAFFLLMTFKILSFSQLKISRDYSLRRHVNFYNLPWGEQLIAWVEM